MGNKNSYDDDQFDKLLTAAFIQKMIEDLEKEEKELEQKPEHVFSDKFERTQEKNIKEYQRKLDMGRFYKSPPGKVAIFLALFILISAAVSVSAIAIRVIFFSPEVTEITKEYFSIRPKRLTPDEIILKQEMGRITSIIEEHSSLKQGFDQMQDGLIKNDLKNDEDYIKLTIDLDDDAPDEEVIIDGNKYTWTDDGFKYIAETNMNEYEFLEIIQKLKRN